MADAGAKIMVRSRVSGLFSNPQYKTDRLEAVTSTGNLEINTKLVIDASGFSSIIGRKLGLVSSWKRYGIGAEYECYCDSVDRETWYLMVGNNTLMQVMHGYFHFQKSGKNWSRDRQARFKY